MAALSEFFVTRDFQPPWRVERTFSWLDHSGRLSNDYEIKTRFFEFDYGLNGF